MKDLGEDFAAASGEAGEGDEHDEVLVSKLLSGGCSGVLYATAVKQIPDCRH